MEAIAIKSKMVSMENPTSMLEGNPSHPILLRFGLCALASLSLLHQNMITYQYQFIACNQHVIHVEAYPANCP